MQQQNQKTCLGVSGLIQIKQQLDQRRINGNLTPDSAPLVLKLLNLIKRLQQAFEHKNTDSTLQQTTSTEQQALVFQLKELTTQNNVLRLQLIALQDELDSQKLKMKGMCTQSLATCKEKSFSTLLKQFRQREEELRQQLVSTTYKYNQLMDLLHEDPGKERDYIKRLLKHKNIVLFERNPLQATQHTSQAQQDIAIQRISILQAQLLARNAEIQRLQNALVDQCADIARRSWNNRKESIQIGLLKEELAYLTSQNQQLQRTLRAQSPLYNLNLPTLRKLSKESNLKLAKATSKQIASNDQRRNYVDDGGLKSQGRKVRRLKTAQAGQRRNNIGYMNVNEDPYHLEQKTKIITNNKCVIASSQTQVQKSNSSKNSHLLLENQRIREHFSRKDGTKQPKNSANKTPLVFLLGQNKKEKGFASPSPRREAKSERQGRQPSMLDHQQKARFEKQIRQKEARIDQLKELLRLSPRKVPTIINKTQNINSQQSQTNNLIINEKTSQSSKGNYSHPTQRQAYLQQKLEKIQMELAEVSQARDRLRHRLQEQQSQTNWLAERDRLKEAILLERQQRETAETKLKQTQQQLIQVNQENISLQRQIKQYPKTEAYRQKELTQHLTKQHHHSEDLADDSELWRLKREVEKLKREISVLQAEKAVLYKQLSQTEAELHNQSREMARFQRSIGKKIRETSP